VAISRDCRDGHGGKPSSGAGGEEETRAKEKEQSGESAGPITTTRKGSAGIHVCFLCAVS